MMKLVVVSFLFSLSGAFYYMWLFANGRKDA
jgi:hypothetical protein